MKNVVGCGSENVVSYVFISDATPSNSSAARPFAAVRRRIGAADVVAAVRSRPLPLLSCQRRSRVPSVAASEFASYQSWRPLAIGGVAATAPVTTVVTADGMVLDPPA